MRRVALLIAVGHAVAIAAVAKQLGVADADAEL